MPQESQKSQKHHSRKMYCIALICLLIFVGMLASASKPRKTSHLSLNELATSDYFERVSAAKLEDRTWFTVELKNLKERPLRELGENCSAYRFLWLRSFHSPLTVTVYFPDKGESILCGKSQMDEPSIGEKDALGKKVVKEIKITLTAEQADKIRETFEDSHFFSLDCYDEYTQPPLIDFELAGRTYRYFYGKGYAYKDGAHWILEGYDHGRHRVLERQSPGQDQVKQLANLLMREAKLLPANAREIY